ncbi:hypothetical protein ABPG75_010213 [Micractinium tetrahymenae]
MQVSRPQPLEVLREAPGAGQGAGRAEEATARSRPVVGDTAAAAAFPPPASEAAPGASSLHTRWSPDEFQWDSSALTATPKPPRLPDRGGSGRAAAALPACGAVAAASSPQVKEEAGEAAEAADAAATMWTEAAPAPLASPRGRRAQACQVCGADVTGLKDYYQVSALEAGTQQRDGGGWLAGERLEGSSEMGTLGARLAQVACILLPALNHLLPLPRSLSPSPCARGTASVPSTAPCPALCATASTCASASSAGASSRWGTLTKPSARAAASWSATTSAGGSSAPERRAQQAQQA